MFYDGDLQSGIAQALKDSKPVACFVPDDGEQSKAWEQSFLGDHEITSLLTHNAVTLRIPSGSQEAGYLTAYFPISVSPTLIIINNGQLVAHLRAGIELEQFKHAVLQALSHIENHETEKRLQEPALNDNEAEVGQSSSCSQHSPDLTSTGQDTTVAEASNVSSSTPPRSASPQTQVASSTSATSSLQQVMEDRRRRLEADKAAKDAAEKEKKNAAVQARRDAASAAPGAPVSNQSLYAQEQRKRKKEAKEERERILRVIETDKAERKEKEAQRRALARAEAEASQAIDADKASESHDHGAPRKWGPQQCSLQVRLFDGTTIRRKFEPGQSLGNAVREWIAELRTDGDTPFTLKQILTPLPNRTITISEEEESLQSLGLLPSATLVMLPIQGYTGAYATDQGIVGKAVSVGYNAASAGGSLFKGALGTVLGFGRPAANTQETRAEGLNRNDSSHRETHPSKDHQLYNGNQLNFEPRKDEDDE